MSNTECLTNFLYVTAPDDETADRIAELIIAKKLAACVNILPGMRSVYEWEGTIEQASEVVLIIKTTKDAAPIARDTIINAHPHDNPCIVALSVDRSGSSGAFLDWISAETKRH